MTPAYDVYSFEEVRVDVVVCEPKNLLAILTQKEYFSIAVSPRAFLHGDVVTGNYVLYDPDVKPNLPLLMIDKTNKGRQLYRSEGGLLRTLNTSGYLLGEFLQYVVYRLDRKLLGSVACEPGERGSQTQGSQTQGSQTRGSQTRVKVLREAGFLRTISAQLRDEVVPFHGVEGNGNYLLCDPATRPETPLILLQKRSQ